MENFTQEAINQAVMRGGDIEKAQIFATLAIADALNTIAVELNEAVKAISLLADSR